MKKKKRIYNKGGMSRSQEEWCPEQDLENGTELNLKNIMRAWERSVGQNESVGQEWT